jgi:superfamily II DNA or RNA helicase
VELTFVPAEVARQSWFFVWQRSSEANGRHEQVLFPASPADPDPANPAAAPADPGDGRSTTDLAELLVAAASQETSTERLLIGSIGGVRAIDQVGRRLDLDTAIEILACLPADNRHSESVVGWARAARAGLRWIRNHGVIPTLSAGGYDVWRVADPEMARGDIAAVAASISPWGLCHSEDGRSLLRPSAAVSALWNAMADHLARSPVSERLCASHVFAGHSATRVEHLRSWAAQQAAVLTPVAPIELVVDHHPPAGHDTPHPPPPGDPPATGDPQFWLTATTRDVAASTGPGHGSGGMLALVRSLRQLAKAWTPAGDAAAAGVELATSNHAGGPRSIPAVALADDDITSLIELEDDLASRGVQVRWPAELSAHTLSLELLPEDPGETAPLADASAIGHGGATGSGEASRRDGAGCHRFAADIEATVMTRWRLLLDGSPLTAAEAELVRQSTGGLVQMRGRWVVVPPTLRQQLRSRPESLTLGALAHRLLSAADSPETAASSSEGGPGAEPPERAGTPDQSDTDETVGETSPPIRAVGRWAEFLDGLLSLTDPEECEQPEGLAAELRPYQRVGVQWVRTLVRLGLGGCLADEMGLGKTVQVIAAHRCDVGRRTTADAAATPTTSAPTLVVCPTSLMGNWEREFNRFSPTTKVVTVGSSAAAYSLGSTGGFSTARLGADAVVLVTYGTLRRSAEAFAEAVWALTVCDEAQHIKNHRSATARAMRCIPARSRLALTGTPIENRVTDLWAIMDWALPGLLGNAEQFRKGFAVPIERDRSQFATRRLGKRIAPFLLRREKSDERVALNLPEKLERSHSVDLTAEQRRLYAEVTDRELGSIRGTDGFERRGRVLALLTALKQICNHPAHFLGEPTPQPGRSAKFDLAERILRSATEAGECSLVFTHYVTMAKLLHRHLQRGGLRTAVLDGSLTATSRQRLVDEFQGGGLDVLILSLRAGGTGLTLTRASQVLHYDRWWNPAVEDQASDRAHRIGQRRHVTVHTLTCRGTLEERIAEMLDEKRSLARSLIGRGEDWIGELTDDDLEGLVRLTLDASVSGGLPTDSDDLGNGQRSAVGAVDLSLFGATTNLGPEARSA